MEKSHLKKFALPKGVDSVEIASVHFDQWILTIGIRFYGTSVHGDVPNSVIDMVHVVFKKPEGFRVLDEGSMLSFPFDKLSKSTSFVHRVKSGGWLELEENAENMILPRTAQEFVVVTDNECISVISYSEPILVGV